MWGNGSKMSIGRSLDLEDLSYPGNDNITVVLRRPEAC